MIESKIMHIAHTVTPTPISSLEPVLSPESEMGVDDDVGVKETLPAIRLDCVVEEDDILSGAAADMGVEVDIEGELERCRWSECCNTRFRSHCRPRNNARASQPRYTQYRVLRCYLGRQSSFF